MLRSNVYAKQVNAVYYQHLKTTMLDVLARDKIGVKYHPERDTFLLVPEGSLGIWLSENVW